MILNGPNTNNEVLRSSRMNTMSLDTVGLSLNHKGQCMITMEDLFTEGSFHPVIDAPGTPLHNMAIQSVITQDGGTHRVSIAKDVLQLLPKEPFAIYVLRLITPTADMVRLYNNQRLAKGDTYFSVPSARTLFAVCLFMFASTALARHF